MLAKIVQTFSFSRKSFQHFHFRENGSFLHVAETFSFFVRNLGKIQHFLIFAKNCAKIFSKIFAKVVFIFA